MSRRKSTLLAIAGLYLLLGLIYAYSVVLAPLKAECGWSVQSMTLVFAVSIVSFIAGSMLGARLLEMQGLRRTVATGAWMLLVGFFGCAFSGGTHVFSQVLGFYGVLASLGIGVTYNVLLPQASAWYPDKAGFAQGFCLMGYGLGGFVLGPVLTLCYQWLSWRWVLGGCGILLAGATAFMAWWVRPPRAEELAGLPTAALGPRADEGMEVRDVVKSRTYRLMFLWLLLLGSIGMAVTGLGRELPLSLGADALGAAFVIGLVNVGSGLGRWGGGVLGDKIGHRRTMLASCSLYIVALLGVSASLLMESLVLQGASLLLLGAGWGIDVVMMTFVAGEAWGQRHLADNISALNANSVLSSIGGSVGAGLLVGACGSYLPLFLLMAVMACVAVLVALGVDRSMAAGAVDPTHLSEAL